jgi:hypothetical protein
MPSSRGFTRKAFQCSLYEAQDVLCETDDVDLVCLQPRPGSGFPLRQRWQRRLLYRDITRRLVFANPGIQRVRLTQDYDLFIVVCQNYWDLLYINAIEGWKDRCRTTVCWLDELLVAEIPKCRYWLHALNQFDHVFVGWESSAEALSDALGRRCHWVGAGVDTLRFSPYPKPPARVVDVYSVGRGLRGVHDVLLQQAASNELFYMHDTFRGADMEALDHRKHRDLLASIAKRSRYFTVAPAKMDLAGETGHQVDIGYRYYEGSAAGAVMIGQAPDCPAFRERFDWPDAVIEVKADGSDLLDVLSDLSCQPDRVFEISQRNAVQALLRHDWLYRWKQVLQVAGVPSSSRMLAREKRLKELATLATGWPRSGTIPGSLCGPVVC